MAVVVLLVLSVAGTTWLTTRQRDSGYRAYCVAHGYVYVPSRTIPDDADAELLGSFGQAAAQQLRCEIAGTLNGHKFVAFEFVLRFRSGRYVRSEARAFVKWEAENFELPEFEILPAEAFYRNAPEHPPPRIEFADDGVFTENYAVLAKNPDAARALLTPEVRERLRPPLVADPNQYVYGKGNTLYWWELGYLPQPADMDQFLASHDQVRAALLV